MSPDPLPWLGWQHPTSRRATKRKKEESHKRNFEDWIANPQNFNMYAYVEQQSAELIPIQQEWLGAKAGDKTFSYLHNHESFTILKRRMERSRSPE